jgi:hypothetical protein
MPPQPTVKVVAVTLAEWDQLRRNVDTILTTLTTFQEQAMVSFADIQTALKGLDTTVQQQAAVIAAHGDALAQLRDQLAVLVAAGTPSQSELQSLLDTVNNDVSALNAAVAHLTASDPAAAPSSPAPTA